MTADVQVLGRIRVADYHRCGKGYREQVCEWLAANAIDPNCVALVDVEVVLLDAPAIRRTEFVPGTDRRWQVGPDGEVVTRIVHSLLRAPLPEHLTDPT